MRIADQIINTIITAGTDTIFSLSGNQIMPIYDAALDQDIRIIHTRHEAGAVFMADGYARSSGRTGIALCTAGPGFTNALGPLFSLKSSESPVVLITGDSPHAMDGRQPFQELNQTAISGELVKESWRLTNSSAIGDAISEAMRLARSGRHGPVHLAIPEDMLAEPAQPSLFSMDDMANDASFAIAAPDLNAILRALDDFQKPLILTGATLALNRGHHAIRQIMDKHHIPVIALTSPRGLNDPMQGKLGDILRAADGIILLDKAPDFTLGFGAPDIMPDAKIVACAAQSETVTLCNQVFQGNMIWGCIADPMLTVAALATSALRKRSSAWKTSVNKLLVKRPDQVAKIKTKTSISTQPNITPAMIMQGFANCIDTRTPPLMVCDGGEFGQWAQAGLPDPLALAAHIFTNGISGGIGGGLPQAIGMAVANPGRHVVAFMGDGSAGFHLAEIETARRANVPVTFIIGNDYRWGAEVEIQKNRYGEDRIHSCDLDADTRYDLIAGGFGVNGILVETADQIEPAIHGALAHDGVSVINILMTGIAAPSF
jgi:acetolactate synthase-1/2/3 large subunit